MNEKNHQERKGIKMKVMLDIFSGKKNPEWPLKNHEMAIIYFKLDILSKRKKINIPNLGYRGFIINIQNAINLPTKMRIYKNVISYYDNDKQIFFKDINGIEEYLFKIAQKKKFINTEYNINNLLTKKSITQDVTLHEKKILLEFYTMTNNFCHYQIKDIIRDQTLIYEKALNIFTCYRKAFNILEKIDKIYPIKENEISIIYDTMITLAADTAK